jgi:diadenosine tetraphosphate (Ap4A) HIT family hydrolase
MSDVAFVLDERLIADTHAVGNFDLSRVLLMNDARFPWLILVPQRARMRDLVDLSRDDQIILLDEVNRCADALKELDRPDKLNIATLGNMVPQLHVHVIARHIGDAAWPRPVWGVGERESYDSSALTSRVASLRAMLSLTSE